MEKAVYKAVFNRKDELSSDGTALIQIEAYLNRKRKYFKTSIHVTPEQWDKKHRRIKNHSNDIRLNKQISDKITEFERFELDRLNAGKPFTLDMLTDVVNGKITTSFIKFMETEIKQGKTAKATKTVQNTTLTRLKEFRNDILFTEMNFDLLSDFERFLTKKELGLNTIHKYFRHLKKFYNLAINKGLAELNSYPFRKFKVKTQETTRQPLSPEELTILENLKLSEENKHLQKVLDMFLFACYTGLRFSDLTALKREHITTIDGAKWIDTRMIKTDSPIRIPLSLLFKGKPLEILERYSNIEKRYLFDDLTNQYVNRSLKDIAKEAEINKRITFHTARHTQATYLLYKGLSITSVQKMLGHKKLQTTQIYSKVLDQTMIKELKAVEF